MPVQVLGKPAAQFPATREEANTVDEEQPNCHFEEIRLLATRYARKLVMGNALDKSTQDSCCGIVPTSLYELNATNPSRLPTLLLGYETIFP